MKATYFILFFLTVSLLHAQEKTWTLEECIRYAVENSPLRNKQEAQNEIYKQNYREAIGQLLPSVQVSTSINVNFGRGLDAETNTYTDINSFRNDYSAYSYVTLFDGLAGITRLKMNKMSQLMGKHQLQQVKDEIAFSTMEAFFNTLYYQELVILAGEQLKESQDNLKQVVRMEELGMKGLPDVAELRAKEAADQYILTQQENMLQISIIQLKEKMFFPIDEELKVSAFMNEEPIVKSQETSRNIYEQSVTFLPKALAANSGLKVQELSYKVAKGNLFPVLSMEGGWSTNFSRFMDGSQYIGFSEQFKNKRGYYVGFTLSVPIFSGFSKIAGVKRSKQQLIIAQNEKDETLRGIYSEIEQAVTDMNG
ncbi:MAG: TolC family protein [Candidatus Azobacteroides sp.]|nr:TolC family protein [Candidatus Azobacteroides sp.]